jgi:hypothetical protein
VTQPANASKAVREKGRRLRVVDLTLRYAVVQGDTGEYWVWLERLTCTCPAGQAHRRCSHVMAAIRARALERQRPFVMFAHDFNHADSFARMQAARNRAAEVYDHAGWVWVEYTSVQLKRDTQAPLLSFEQLQAAADQLF